MKKLCLAVAVALVASFTVLASSPAQSQGYSNVTVTVSERTVVGGNSILIEATVDPSSTECEWELSFMGETVTGSGNSISETFSTPEVDDEEQHFAVAICTYDDGTGGPTDGPPAALGSGGGTGSLGTSLAQAEVEAIGVGRQILLPEDGDDDGDDDGDGDGDDDDDGDGDDDGNGGGDGDNGGLLPNTGGERLAWLIIGAMLVLVGGGVVVASRRRDA